MNLKQIAQKLWSKTQDDEGLIRRGQFTPFAPIDDKIKSTVSNIRIGSGPTLGQAFNQVTSRGTQAFNPYQGIAENKSNNAFLRGGADIVNQGLKSFTNMSTLGLVQPKMGERQTKAGLIGSIGGGLAGFAVNPLGKVMGSTDTLMARVAPKATSLTSKVLKGLSSEALQTLGYSGASLLGSKLGLNQQTGQFTPKDLASNMVMGSILRGVGGATNLKNIKIKGMSPQVFTSDKTILNEAKQKLRVGIEIDQFSKLGKDLENMYKQYGLASFPDWNKLSIDKKVNILDDRLSEMARQWGDKVTMGIYGGKGAQGYKPDMKGQFSNMADKKVRFEIDDSSFKFKPVEGGYGNKTFKLGDLVEHKELFKNYPELKNVDVSFNGKGNASVFEQGNKGSFNGNKIEINNVNSTDEAKSTLLHEIQHAIQTKEGFAKGGNTEQFRFGNGIENIHAQNERRLKEIRPEALKIGDKIEDLSFSGKQAEANKLAESPLWQEYQKLEQQNNQIRQFYNNPMKGYQRLSGEIESRDVSARMNLTPEQRARTQPYVSQGIPQNEWITKFDDNTSLSSPIKTGTSDLVKGDTVLYNGEKYKFVSDYGVSGDKRLIEDAYGGQTPVLPNQITKVSSAEGVSSYGMGHRPTETKATADNITQEVSDMGLPKDFYQHPEYYANMDDKSYQESFNVLKKIKGNPEAEITIYRASPKNELNSGDWVTLSRNYAKGESLSENTPVNSFKVKAKDIQFAGDDINEFGYFPQSQISPIKTGGVSPLSPESVSKVENKLPPHLQKIVDKQNAIKPDFTIEEFTPKGFEQSNIETPPRLFEKLPNETGDMARARMVGYQIDNGKVKLTNTPSGWEARISDVGGENLVKSGYQNKQQLINDVYETLNPDIVYPKNLSPESKGIKITETPKIKLKTISLEQPTGPELKQRGFSASVQEAPNVSKKVKQEVLGGYETKPNDVLMGEAKALLNEGVDLKNINRIENIDQKIAATIQEAINLDAAGKHEEAAALFNNLSELGTQVGRGTQAFSLLNKMSPEAISLSVAGKIKKYNLSHNKKLPELTGEQQKQLSKQVNEALKFAPGTKERGVAIGRVNETINSFIPSTFADKFITVWKAGLLSSLRTHERNIVGNTLMQASEQASLYPAAGADYLMSLATGKRSLVASQKGSLKGAIEGGQTAADVIKYGFDPSGTEIGKYETKKVTWGNNPLEQNLKKVTDVVFNTLEAEDKVFWKSSYNRSLYNQAITQAVNEGKKGNSKYIQKLFDNATEEMKQTAFNDANYATFKDKNMLSGAIGQYKSWVNRQTGPAAESGKIVSEMLMPFTGVPTSIVGKTVAYSPIGLVKGSVDFGRVVAGSEVPGLQRQAAQEIGRGVIGSGIFGLGAYLMSQGLMTGQAKDQKERDQWALEGKQENSIFVNGKWRSINSVGPQTLVLLAGAKANETANDTEQNLGTYGFSTLNDQLNQTFLSGVQQPLAAINDPQGNKAKSYLGGQVSSLIPNIVKDTSKAFDPLKREVDTSTIGSSILGRVQQSIPFARNKMIPQRDVLGNEIAQTPTGIGAYFDLFNSTTPISNNVVNELSRLNQAGYSYTPSKLDKDQTIGKEKMTLNQAQLDRLETVTGLATDKALNDLFNTTAYQSMSDDEKQNIVKKTVDNTRKNVRANINLKNIQEKSYVKSSDSQLAELGGFSMFTKAVTTNPKAAMNALLTGNPIRKTTDGNIVVLERQNDVGSYDLGDTTSQVDHAIPLSLGGTNEVRNLQILSNEEHAIKTKTDMYLLDQVQSGKMPLKEAQEKAKKWRDTALSLPKDAQSQMIDEIDSESPDKQSDGSQVYKLVSDTGNVTLVDLGTPIQQPEYTGFDAIDKKLKSSYKSAITKRINNIVKLYEDGQLSAKEANKLIGELNTQYSSGTGTKKKSKKKITFKVTSPKALPKITLKISSPVSRVKLKSAPKIKLSKTDNRKYTIKA